jgi:hypothetical protein
MALREQILAGAGGELRPSKSGRRHAHAPYSSAALAANVFGRWLGSEQHLRIAGLARFSEPLEVGSRQRNRARRRYGERRLPPAQRTTSS